MPSDVAAPPAKRSRGLVAEAIHAGYPKRPVLFNAGLRLEPGQAKALIGPNGAGKSTLLKVLTGHLQPESGRVLLDGRELTSLSRRQISRKLAVTPQSLAVGFALKARDVVLLGRTPYFGVLGTATANDRRAVDRAIEQADIGEYVDRPMAQLSGGEAQRVILAMALAQESSFLLLDEPTVHLDLAQQSKFLATLRRLQRTREVSILAVVHDLNQAAFFDRVVLMSAGRTVFEGTPTEVLTADRVRQVFGAAVRIWQDESGVQVALSNTG